MSVSSQSTTCSGSNGNSDGRAAFAMCMLASGSKGNCIHVSAGSKSLLVDAGLSAREIERRMHDRALAPERLQAIIVSHEHSDHIRGVGVLARRYGLPVYMSSATAGAALSRLGKIPQSCYFEAGIPFRIAPFSIHPFNITHDAVDPVGFTIGMNGSRIGIATDLGTVTGLVEEHLKGCRLLVIEANHDLDMLNDGPYPWPLKQRIRSRHGHLSNEAAGELLRAVLNDKLKHVVLGHLSETNNTSRRALEIVRKAIDAPHVDVMVARQDRSGPVLTLRTWP